MVRVLLINPPFSQPKESKKRCMIPLGLAYIASYLRKHDIDVKILDCVVEGYNNDIVKNGIRTFGLSDTDIKYAIYDYEPDFVGVSCLMTVQRHNAFNVCRLAKEVNHKIITVIGGCHPSAFPKETLKNQYIDVVVIGEGEQAMLDIVQKNERGIIRKKIIDINSIPWPARDLLPIDKYFRINMPENIFSPNKRVIQVLTSRGCPFSCVFCSTTNLHGKWRGRDEMDVFREIEYLVDEYGVDEINFVDENLVMDRKRIERIMDGLSTLDISWSNPGGIWIDGLDEKLLEKMKRAGCYQLTFPVESINKEILKKVIHKPLKVDRVENLVRYCHKLGIDVHVFFVEGFPEQTKVDMMNDFEYAKRVGFDSASFHIITPLPGSRLYTQYKDIVDLDNINYIHSTIPHPTMTPLEIEDLVNSFNVNFNKNWKWKHPLKFIKKYMWIPFRKGFRGTYARI